MNKQVELLFVLCDPRKKQGGASKGVYPNKESLTEWVGGASCHFYFSYFPYYTLPPCISASPASSLLFLPPSPSHLNSLHIITLSESHLKEPPLPPPPLPPGTAGSPPVDRRAARRCGGCSSCSGRWCPSTAGRSDGWWSSGPGSCEPAPWCPRRSPPADGERRTGGHDRAKLLVPSKKMK